METHSKEEPTNTVGIIDIRVRLSEMHAYFLSKGPRKPHILYGRRETAFLLSISLNTLGKLTARRKIYPARLGGAYFFSSDKLQDFARELVGRTISLAQKK